MEKGRARCYEIQNYGVPEMKCPHCTKPIDDKLISKHLASKGGKASKRQLSPETAKKMVEAREKKRKAAIEQKEG